MTDDDVIKVPTVATVSCKAYRERIHKLEAERDRLREALEEVLADHDERIRLYGWREGQTNRLRGTGMNDAKIYYASRIEGDGGATEIDGVHVVLEEDYDALSHRCDKLWEVLKLFVKLEDVQRHYPIEVALALAVLGETEGKE
jgi:hypothetical protein